MDNIKDFIKKLKVLYVEDEEQARIIFGKFLSKKFDISISCNNGFEAYDTYIKAVNDNEPFDLIISDINMPKIDGIELLEKIRELNKDIPFIFTTARSESEQMIKAINLNVHSYLLKPIDFSLMDITIEKICKDIYYKKNYELQKKETEAYLSVLNKEAIVIKTDFDGNITFVNDAFIEVSGYLEEEILGKSHSILKHPDVPQSLYNEIWEVARSGKIWEGTLKNLSKNNETYYVNSKIIPIYDDSGKNIIQFISIRFLVTEEENQRRAQNKRFIEQVTQYKKEIATLKKEKEQLLSKASGANDNTQFLKDKIITHENKIKSLLSQLEIYETQNIEYNKMDLMMKQDKKKQFDMMARQLLQIKNQNKALAKEAEDLRTVAIHKDKQIDLLENKKLEHEKRISNLVDLVTNLQKELKVLKGEEKEGE
ncbi:response regulator [Arcobacter sp.]|uniref:response regulator n=1 Tax=Arcobacter sp. TaxID=1872629 RepID=UPI003D0B36A7